MNPSRFTHTCLSCATDLGSAQYCTFFRMHCPCEFNVGRWHYQLKLSLHPKTSLHCYLRFAYTHHNKHKNVGTAVLCMLTYYIMMMLTRFWWFISFSSLQTFAITDYCLFIFFFFVCVKQALQSLKALQQNKYLNASRSSTDSDCSVISSKKHLVSC